MPSRYTYQITNVDEGKAAQQDQSYKSCVITLLIFFFLCVILICVGLPLNLYRSHDPDQQSESTKETERPPKSHERYMGYDSATESTKENYTPVTEEGIAELESTSPMVKINKEHVYAGNTLHPLTEEDISNTSASRSNTEASTSTESNRINVTVSSNEYDSDRQTTDRQLASSEVIDEDTPTEASILSSITKGYGSEDAMNESTTEASTSTKLNRIDVKVFTNESESGRRTTDRQLASSEVIDEDTPTEASILSSIPKGYGSEDAMNESTTEASTSTKLNRIDVKVFTNESESGRRTTDRQLANSEVIDEDTPTEASILSSITKGYGSEDAMNESTTEASTSTKLNRIDVKVFTNESESGRRTTDRQLASSEVIDEDTPTEASILSSITKGYGSEDAMNESTTEASTSTKLNRIDVKVFTNESESGRRTTDRQLASSEVIDEDTPTEASILSSIPKGYGSEDAMNESTTEASTNKLQQTTVGQLISSEVINEETSTEANILSSTTEKYENEVLTNRSTTEESKRNDSVDTNTTEASTQYPILSTTNDSVTSEPIIPTTTTVPESTTRINNEVCTTGECKNLASKMLFYMNHTTDPCEDFYEYACGGFEANPQVTELILEDVAYQRILHQMQKENDRSSSFAKYYDSCIQYESTSQTERIQLAKEAISKIGRFFSFDDDWDQNPVNFTDLVAKLLLYNNPLLFDVTPDLDEHSPKQFTLKIGPTTFNNPFDTDEMSDPCHIDQSEKEKEMVDLKELHEEYIKCKSDPVKLAESRTETFSALGICNQTSISFNYTQCIKIINFNIDVELIEYFLAFFPSKDKIREAYLMKNYTLFTIEELQEKFKVINWTQLIKSLTREWIQPNITVQVYFSDALTKGMESLYDFADRFPRNLHNALLGLYANKLYHEFVLSKHEDAKKHCLRVAANVLIQEASNLYISSFSKDQLAYMNRTIHSLFLNLTETLKLSVKKAEWITQDGYNALIAKINSLQIATPYVSNYLSQREANQVNLSSNYFENSMSLMRRYRELMYAELSTNPGNPEQIWTHYATPYQSKGLAIYGLNLIVIPFGAIDWSFKYDEDQFDYITLATAGNVIAHEIAHHFDANGIYYWNGTRDTKNTLFNENDTRDMNFKEYIENQKNTYPDPMNITLPFTGQTVSYEISQLTLNERLSEAMGLRLAYDTLYRLRSSKESSIDLPWLEFHFDRLFYLAYAQMHCTKSPLTSSYVSLYENEYLPSRIRILVSAWSNKLLGEAWSCPQGSRIMPSYSLSAFPYLETN